jgi:hypothetical protein
MDNHIFSGFLFIISKKINVEFTNAKLGRKNCLVCTWITVLHTIITGYQGKPCARGLYTDYCITYQNY